MAFFSRQRHTTVHAPDYRFIAVVGALVLFGVVMLSSASAPEAYKKFGDTYYYLRHQVFLGVLPGIILCAIASLVDYRLLRKAAFGMLVASLVLLVLVFIPGIGTEYGSAHSWIGFGNYSMQPSEIVKLTFLIYLATWLESRKNVSDVKEGLVPFLSVLAVIIILMMLQPDMGTLSIIIAMAMAVYFTAGASLQHVGMVIMGGIIGMMALINISPYRAARMTTFLHPELDPQGIGYHINQAFLAIGSGGFWGRGFGLSRQKYQYLPEVIGDSMFAIIAEEMGFLFSVALVVGFAYFIYRGFAIAQRAPDTFGKLLGVGIVAWLGTQALMNIGAMVGLMPLTGVPLPFISQGGSAMIVSLIAVGVLINISRQTTDV